MKNNPNDDRIWTFHYWGAPRQRGFRPNGDQYEEPKIGVLSTKILERLGQAGSSHRPRHTRPRWEVNNACLIRPWCLVSREGLPFRQIMLLPLIYILIPALHLPQNMVPKMPITIHYPNLASFTAIRSNLACSQMMGVLVSIVFSSLPEVAIPDFAHVKLPTISCNFRINVALGSRSILDNYSKFLLITLVTQFGSLLLFAVLFYYLIAEWLIALYGAYGV